MSWDCGRKSNFRLQFDDFLFLWWFYLVDVAHRCSTFTLVIFGRIITWHAYIYIYPYVYIYIDMYICIVLSVNVWFWKKELVPIHFIQLCNGNLSFRLCRYIVLCYATCMFAWKSPIQSNPIWSDPIQLHLNLICYSFLTHIMNCSWWTQTSVYIYRYINNNNKIIDHVNVYACIYTWRE